MITICPSVSPFVPCYLNRRLKKVLIDVSNKTWIQIMNYKNLLTFLISLTLLINISCNAAIQISNTDESIYILRQANDIPIEQFVQVWPMLNNCISAGIQIEISEKCVNGLLTTKAKYGALNLKAQIVRNNGDHQLASDLIQSAIEMEPDQHLHYFQQAINHFQQLVKTKSGSEKWKLSVATSKAYKQAFNLNPNQFHYRYYVIYNYLQVPESMGGNKEEALRLADEAIALGNVAFYPVRADIYYNMGNKELALQDYLTALKFKQYKRSSFKKALKLSKNNPFYTGKINKFIKKSELIITNGLLDQTL